jgi:hypothetical protein
MDMATKTLLVACLVLHVSTAHAQLSTRTFAGIPLWADSALRTAGLNQRFILSSTLNPAFAFGDFDRDGLVDIAIEVKGAGGCGIAVAHRIDRSVHLVGVGRPVGNGRSQVPCGNWGMASAGHGHRQASFGHDLLFVTDPGVRSGWLVWDGHSYVWIQAE